MVHGTDALGILSAELALLNSRRTFLVTSKSVQSSPIGAMMRQIRGTASAGLFDRALPHQPWTTVSELVVELRQAQPDTLLAVGGGSTIDTAKAAALAAHIVGPFLEQHVGLRKVMGCVEHSAVPRIIAVPTTLTGAERNGAFSVNHDGRNVTYVDEHVRPVVVIQDPAVLALTPRSLLAESAMNSIAHSVERLLAGAMSPLTRPFHTEALRLHSKHLAIAYNDPSDAAAHDALLVASAFASGWAGQEAGGGGVIHAAAHGVVGLHPVAHGAVYGIILPVLLRFNAVASPDGAAAVTAALTDGRDTDTEAGVEALTRLRDSVSLPHRLRDLGIDLHDLPRMAELTWAHYSTARNVRPIESADEILALLTEAY